MRIREDQCVRPACFKCIVDIKFFYGGRVSYVFRMKVVSGKPDYQELHSNRNNCFRNGVEHMNIKCHKFEPSRKEKMEDHFEKEWTKPCEKEILRVKSEKFGSERIGGACF